MIHVFFSFERNIHVCIAHRFVKVAPFLYTYLNHINKNDPAGKDHRIKHFIELELLVF